MKSASAKELLVRDSGPLRRCTLARTSKRNALSLDLCRQLQGAVESAGADIALIAIDHEGDTFSSGADLIEIAPFLTTPATDPGTSPTLQAIWDLFGAIEECATPVVAAIDGRCLAGGLELALACDLIAATKAARFFDAHLAGGLLPAGGAAIRLPERISRSRSFQLLVEGVEVDADQALDWGLVDTVFETRDELSGWLGKLGDRLARYPPGLAPSIKRQLGATRHPRGGAEFELQLQHLQEYAERNRGYLRERLRRYT